MRKIHFMNDKQRDAHLAILNLTYEAPYRMGVENKTVTMRKYLAAAESKLHDDMVLETGLEDYGQALIDGDPEIDMEMVGRFIFSTDKVFLSNTGDVLYCPPKITEVILAPDGSEKERREPKDVEANVNDELPIRWTGKKIPKQQAVQKFVFKRTIQLSHVDGLTYDYLHAIATELNNENKMVLIGGGKDGKQPLIFNMNGTPYRGFLEGRIDGAKYMLLLHLSNMELRRPENK